MQLTPNAERALLAYLEAGLVHDHLDAANPWPTMRTSHSARREHAPLNFNTPSVPDLPDWFEYHQIDDFDLYIYH